MGSAVVTIVRRGGGGEDPPQPQARTAARSRALAAAKRNDPEHGAVVAKSDIPNEEIPASGIPGADSGSRQMLQRKWLSIADVGGYGHRKIARGECERGLPGVLRARNPLSFGAENMKQKGLLSIYICGDLSPRTRRLQPRIAPKWQILPELG